MKTLKLEVGKTYRNRKGEEVKIVRKDNKSWGYWDSSNGEWYHESGKWSCIIGEHPKDLIEEVEEVTKTRHTFDIPKGVKKVIVVQESNRIVVEMVPEKEPKPGDVLVNTNGSVYIFKEVYDDGWHNNFVWVDSNGRAFYSNTTTCSPGRPATPEEAQVLFDALKKEGKRWNPETMQVEEVPEYTRILEWVEVNIKGGYYNHDDVAEAIEAYLKHREGEK